MNNWWDNWERPIDVVVDKITHGAFIVLSCCLLYLILKLAK